MKWDESLKKKVLLYGGGGLALAFLFVSFRSNRSGGGVSTPAVSDNTGLQDGLDQLGQQVEAANQLVLRSVAGLQEMQGGYQDNSKHDIDTLTSNLDVLSTSVNDVKSSVAELNNRMTTPIATNPVTQPVTIVVDTKQQQATKAIANATVAGADGGKIQSDGHNWSVDTKGNVFKDGNYVPIDATHSKYIPSSVKQLSKTAKYN